ncbi:MAG: helix-turn-helix transcriptional regulator [Clostridiales bacterium]|nr:helix-turn-helix transcriptional regulator [Clostridiales bacterium]
MQKINSIWSAKETYKRITEFCANKGWTINRLAAESFITPSTLYSISSRNTLPSMETLKAICDALDITLATFFNVDNPTDTDLLTAFKELSEDGKILLTEVAKRMK